MRRKKELMSKHEQSAIKSKLLMQSRDNISEIVHFKADDCNTVTVKSTSPH